MILTFFYGTTLSSLRILSSILTFVLFPECSLILLTILIGNYDLVTDRYPQSHIFAQKKFERSSKCQSGNVCWCYQACKDSECSGITLCTLTGRIIASIPIPPNSMKKNYKNSRCNKVSFWAGLLVDFGTLEA